MKNNQINKSSLSKTLDFSNCAYIGEVHKVIKDTLDLPDWYGENLDALWDILTGSIETPVNITIQYDPKTKAAKALENYVSIVISIFKEASEQFGEIVLSIQ